MHENSAYTVLGVAKSASEKDIKAAYVNLVKKYDPEKHTERFMVIQQAYDRLRQPRTRAHEDLLALNMAGGDYLFQEDDKWRSPEPPDDDLVAQVRSAYTDDPLDETKKVKFSRLLFSRAHYLVTRKQLNEAIRDWTEILEHDPANARARHNLELACMHLGVSYALHGLDDEAVELMERALKMNPDNTSLIHNLAILAERTSDYLRAAKYWREVINRWKNTLAREQENEYLRCLIVEALGHQEDIGPLVARAQQKAAAQGQPTSTTPPAPAQSSAATMPRVENQTPPASSSGPVAASGGAPAGQQPRPMGSRTNVPKLNSTDSIPTGSPGAVASLERYREIVQLRPDDFDSHYQLCNKLMEERLWAEAEEELKNLARKHPKNTEVLNTLGWALLNNGKKDEAFASWKRSMSIDPANAQTRETLVRAHLEMGKAYRKQGIFTQALVHFKHLLSLMPRSAEVHLEIAATYDMKGDVRSAVGEYERVMALDPKNKVAKKALTDLKMKR